MTKNRVLITALAVIIGFLAGLQIMNDSKSYAFINVNSVAVFSNELNAINNEIEGLKSIIVMTSRELNKYQLSEFNSEYIADYLAEETNRIKAIAGYTNVRGEGVLIKLSDNESNTQRNTNYDLIHDVDVAMIINDLIDSGAEAISINGKRILAKTEIVCVGPLIKINGEGVGAPFIIKAIGNKDLLSAAINAPNTYAYNLKNVYGLGIETMKSDFILIPKYSD
ncbi:MAG: Division initiation protein [Clostridiales bacterium 38_11]|nr:MAG: Division initiation protein [Clostridiales bacterium 38_11]HBH12172.1 DUF881 domain-containing protein [Clostridiales bacterium]